MTKIIDGQERPQEFEIDCDEVKKALEEFEYQTEYDTGVRHISGGFASADIYDYDECYFYIELKWGVQNDCENRVNTENWKMDRLTLNITD